MFYELIVNSGRTNQIRGFPKEKSCVPTIIYFTVVYHSTGFVDFYRSPNGPHSFSFHIFILCINIFSFLLVFEFLPLYCKEKYNAIRSGEILLIYRKCVHKVQSYLTNGV